MRTITRGRKIPIEQLTIADIERMFSKAITNGNCYELHRLPVNPTTKPGRANVTINKQAYTGYRVTYTLGYGQIPSNLEVDHMCRNSSCIRISHLQLVTPTQNQILYGDAKHKLRALELQGVKGTAH
jgi:hypothetical protein